MDNENDRLSLSGGLVNDGSESHLSFRSRREHEPHGYAASFSLVYMYELLVPIVPQHILQNWHTHLNRSQQRILPTICTVYNITS